MRAPQDLADPIVIEGVDRSPQIVNESAFLHVLLPAIRVMTPETLN